MNGMKSRFDKGFQSEAWRLSAATHQITKSIHYTEFRKKHDPVKRNSNDALKAPVFLAGLSRRKISLPAVARASANNALTSCRWYGVDRYVCVACGASPSVLRGTLLRFFALYSARIKNRTSRCNMEIDLDNLVFNGLDEAEERNAQRLDDADQKAQAIIADDDCGDACKI
jgi:hypothetical protein